MEYLLSIHTALSSIHSKLGIVVRDGKIRSAGYRTSVKLSKNASNNFSTTTTAIIIIIIIIKHFIKSN